MTLLQAIGLFVVYFSGINFNQRVGNTVLATDVIDWPADTIFLLLSRSQTVCLRLVSHFQFFVRSTC